MATNWVKCLVDGVFLASSEQDLDFFKSCSESKDFRLWGEYTQCSPDEHYYDISFVSIDSLQEQERHVWVLCKTDLVQAYEVLTRLTHVYISADDDNLITGMLDFHATFSDEGKL